MVVRLNAAPQAMNTLRMLRVNEEVFARASNRIATGRRVTSAAADAAALAAGKKFQAQTLGWQNAQRNIQNAISLLQTAEGAMRSITSLVARIRELAVRAASSTLAERDRLHVQAEIDALRDNIGQIVDGTEFNGIQLLRGVEFRPPPLVDVSGVLGAVEGVGNSNTESGSYPVVVTQPPHRAQTVGDTPATPIIVGPVQLTITGPQGTATITLNAGDAPASWVAAINAQSAVTGVTALITDATTRFDDGTQPDPFGDGYLMLQTDAYGSAAQVSITATGDAVNDHTGFGLAPSVADGQDMSGTINGGNAVSGGTSTTFTLTAGGTSGDANGLRITFQNPPLGAFQAALLAGTYPAPGVFLGNALVTAFPIQIRPLELYVQSGPNQPDTQTVTINPLRAGAISIGGGGTLGGIDVTSVDGANEAIAVADQAMEQIITERAHVGAAAMALEVALSNAYESEVHHAVSGSRMMDGDLAQDTLALLQAQILQHTGAAVLAQVNFVEASGLRLLAAGRVPLPGSGDHGLFRTTTASPGQAQQPPRVQPVSDGDLKLLTEASGRSLASA